MTKEDLLKTMRNLSNNFTKRLTQLEVAEYYKVSSTAIQYYIKKYNLNDKDYWVHLPKNYITLFDSPSNISSYWLGYLQADGCVDDNRLVLECASKDRILLERFCKDANISQSRICDRHRITAGNTPDIFCSRLDLYKSNFTTFPNLSKRKSWLNEHLPENIIFWPWLEGLFHGDGSFNPSKGGHQICFLVREPMCSEIIEKLGATLPSPSSIWKTEDAKTKGLFKISVGTGRKVKNPELNNHLFIHKKWREAIPKSYLSRKEEKIVHSLLRYFDISSL